MILKEDFVETSGKKKKRSHSSLSIKVTELIRNYYRAIRPIIYLFEEQKEGKKYSERSLEEVLKKSVKLAGIKKRSTCIG